MKKTSFLLVFMLACNLVVAQKYFIKFEGIDGESKNETHQRWSDIESFNQELGNILTVIATSRRNTGSLGKSISIVKKIDKSSPKIMEALTRGERIPKVEIEISRSRNNVIYRYELENVMVTKYIVMGNDPELPTEEITISFENQKVRYTEYDETGRRVGDTETEYDTRRN